MQKKLIAKGFTLPLVMGFATLFFILFSALHSNLEQARTRLARQKHQAAAHWLAVSGLDLAETRIAKGTYRLGEVLAPPPFQQGRFVVTSQRQGGSVVFESVGHAANQKVVMTRTVALP